MNVFAGDTERMKEGLRAVVHKLSPFVFSFYSSDYSSIYELLSIRKIMLVFNDLWISTTICKSGYWESYRKITGQE